MKLVHLVGFITKEFVRMHGHMNVKWVQIPFPEMSDSEIRSVLPSFHLNKDEREE